MSPFTPYPARVDTGRVADETAEVRLLAPRHAFFTTPNRITAADFAGWVQERGSFLLEAADPHYQELLSARDPWPQNEGEKKGLLTTAAVGRGTWTYVGLNLFRQLYVGNAVDCEVDKLGRLLIPASLREAASLTREVMWLGALKHIQLWDKARWEHARDALLADPIKSAAVQARLTELGM